MPGKHNAGGCGCCGCEVCTDLFAENWAMRLCAGSPYTTGLTGPQQTANQDYIDAINSYFSNVSISWVDTSFTIGATSYGAKGVSAVYVDSFTVYCNDIFGATSSFTVLNTRLSFGGLWLPSGTTRPSKCRPGWWWSLSAQFNGYDCYMFVANTFTYGSIPNASVNGDGIVDQVTWVDSPGTDDECQPPENVSFNSASFRLTQIRGTASPDGYTNPIFGTTTIKVGHSTGAVSLASC